MTSEADVAHRHVGARLRRDGGRK